MASWVPILRSFELWTAWVACHDRLLGRHHASGYMVFQEEKDLSAGNGLGDICLLPHC